MEECDISIVCSPFGDALKDLITFCEKCPPAGKEVIVVSGGLNPFLPQGTNSCTLFGITTCPAGMHEQDF